MKIKLTLLLLLSTILVQAQVNHYKAISASISYYADDGAIIPYWSTPNPISYNITVSFSDMTIELFSEKPQIYHFEHEDLITDEDKNQYMVFSAVYNYSTPCTIFLEISSDNIVNMIISDTKKQLKYKMSKIKQ